MTVFSSRVFRSSVFILVVFLSLSVLEARAASSELSSKEKRNNTKYFSILPKVAVNPENKLNDEKVSLGLKLFFDPRLSKSGFISCNSCHNIGSGGVDNLPTSIGHGWNIGPRNAPTVFNAALNGSQFWDGRASDVEEQAGGPILNPGEMGETEKNVLKKLNSIPEYKKSFKVAFPDDRKIKYENVAKAIAAFERTLLTPSRFDDYLSGNGKALSTSEKRGLNVFIDKGCVGCHNGVNIGGGSFQKFDYGEDLGRFEVTKKEADKRFFRVASLRNVEVTYPYFHDGKVWSLSEAVRIMGEKQLGVKLSDRDIRSIVAFLKTLTGTVPNIVVPSLPPSTDKTPRPDFK